MRAGRRRRSGTAGCPWRPTPATRPPPPAAPYGAQQCCHVRHCHTNRPFAPSPALLKLVGSRAARFWRPAAEKGGPCSRVFVACRPAAQKRGGRAPSALPRPPPAGAHAASRPRPRGIVAGLRPARRRRRRRRRRRGRRRGRRRRRQCDVTDQPVLSRRIGAQLSARCLPFESMRMQAGAGIRGARAATRARARRISAFLWSTASRPGPAAAARRPASRAAVRASATAYGRGAARAPSLPPPPSRAACRLPGRRSRGTAPARARPCPGQPAVPCPRARCRRRVPGRIVPRNAGATAPFSAAGRIARRRAGSCKLGLLAAIATLHLPPALVATGPPLAA